MNLRRLEYVLQRVHHLVETEQLEQPHQPEHAKEAQDGELGRVRPREQVKELEGD